MPTNLFVRTEYEAHRKKQGQTIVYWILQIVRERKEMCSNCISVWWNPFSTLRGEGKNTKLLSDLFPVNPNWLIRTDFTSVQYRGRKHYNTDCNVPSTALNLTSTGTNTTRHKNLSRKLKGLMTNICIRFTALIYTVIKKKKKNIWVQFVIG